MGGHGVLGNIRQVRCGEIDLSVGLISSPMVLELLTDGPSYRSSRLLASNGFITPFPDADSIEASA